MLGRQKILQLAGETSFFTLGEIYQHVTHSMKCPEITSSHFVECNGVASMNTFRSLESSMSRARKKLYPEYPESIDSDKTLMPAETDQRYTHLRMNKAHSSDFFVNDHRITHVHRNTIRQPRILIFSSDILFQKMVEANRVF